LKKEIDAKRNEFVELAKTSLFVLVKMW